MTMTDRNGESRLDLEHELPASEDNDTPVTEGVAPENQAQPSVESELAKLKAERDSLYERVARMQAEFENARRRQQKEQQEFRDYALTNAIQSLLPILDSMDRALQTPQEGPDFHKGIELIDRQFHDALSKLGVEPIEAKGQLFDPAFHQAVQMVESDEVPENHVASELQRGYKIRERLLRPAMVTVAKKG